MADGLQLNDFGSRMGGTKFLHKKVCNNDLGKLIYGKIIICQLVSSVFLIRSIQLAAAKANHNRKGVMQPVYDNNVYRHELANARDKPQLQLNVEKLK